MWKPSGEKSERYKTPSRAGANCRDQKWMRGWWEKRWRAAQQISAAKWPLSVKSRRLAGRIIRTIISRNIPARQVRDLSNHMLNSHAPINRMHVCVSGNLVGRGEINFGLWLIKQSCLSGVVRTITLWPACACVSGHEPMGPCQPVILPSRLWSHWEDSSSPPCWRSVGTSCQTQITHHC